MLVRLRPVATQPYNIIQLVTRYEPDISHLRIFSYAVYVPISLPLCTKIGPYRRMGIYVGYDSTSIIHYLEPLTSDLFTTCFTNCHFNKIVFSSLGGDKNVNIPEEQCELSWTTPTLTHLNLRTVQSEN